MCIVSIILLIFDMYSSKFCFICDEKTYMTYSTQLHKRGKVLLLLITVVKCCYILIMYLFSILLEVD